MKTAAPQDVLQVRRLFESPTLALHDVLCTCDCAGKTPSKCGTVTRLAFPYFGAYVRHVGSVETVIEPNQVVFFNEDEEFSERHPVKGGDAFMTVDLDPQLLLKLCPAAQLNVGEVPTFKRQRRSIEASRVRSRVMPLKVKLHE